jgi:hypothetical protein
MSTSGITFEERIARLRQDPLQVARDVAHAGERVVGYVGNDIPVALIFAAGAFPVRVYGWPRGATPRADRFVESSFTPELRLIAEKWLDGSLDHLDAVIFSRGDDSGQRAYYYLCELQRRGLCRGPRPLLFDVATLARTASIEHTLDSVRLLAEALGTATDKLGQAAQRMARRAALLTAVRARRALPAPIPASAAWAVEFAAGCDWRDDFDSQACRWLDEAAPLGSPKRVMLAGDPVPDNQLHLAVEACGASLVLERTMSAEVGEIRGNDALGSIAHEYQRRESPVLSMRNNGWWLADCALSVKADAVILWASEQNEALPWEVVRQMQTLRAAKIPALLLARQPWEVSATVLAEVARFLNAIGEAP